MRKISDIFVTIVIVLDAKNASSSDYILKIANILRSAYSNYEIIIIDNGLLKNQYNRLTKLLDNTSCLRVIKLSRNTDIDTAFFAGIDNAIGDFVCTITPKDPAEQIPQFITENQNKDIVFGVATNLKRKNYFHEIGAKVFYWYSMRFLGIYIPKGSTYFTSLNRSAVNAITRSGRHYRHLRHMVAIIGFSSINKNYKLEEQYSIYSPSTSLNLATKALDIVFNYSSHPLKAVSYFGIFAGLINVIYALYVVVINISSHEIARGWTSLSLQSSFMFFILFMILAVLAEYIGKILNETQHEPPYHIMQELSSTVSIADETRRNVTR